MVTVSVTNPKSTLREIEPCAKPMHGMIIPLSQAGGDRRSPIRIIGNRLGLTQESIRSQVSINIPFPQMNVGN